MAGRVGLQGARAAWFVVSAALVLVVLRGLVWLVVSGVQAARGEFRATMDTMMLMEPSPSLPDGGRWLVRCRSRSRWPTNRYLSSLW